MPKKVQPLSDIEVKSKKPTNKDAKLFDGGGLFLYIASIKLDSKGKPLPTSKLWRLKYRFEGKEKLLSLGAYPAVTLADARQRREDARKLLANGIDPGDVKKAQKAASFTDAENSFEVIAREWHTKFTPTWTPGHVVKLLSAMTLTFFHGFAHARLKS